MPFWEPPLEPEEDPHARKPRRTITGRVVYDRPWHTFVIGDATRILNKIYIPLLEWDPSPKHKGGFKQFLEAVTRVIIEAASRVFENYSWDELIMYLMKQALKHICIQVLEFIGRFPLNDKQREALDKTLGTIWGI